MLKVSVIIPCYNQGHHIQETLDSVLKQTYRDVEVIIVNDGSDDGSTTSLLNQIDVPNVQILHTENQGLAAARNNGIRVAEGQMILPLDSDDLIAPEYVEQAVAILEENEDVGIVYCRAKLFGAVETEWALPPYSLKEMLLDNVIFCSAMYRKSEWERVGGYDPGMIHGWEDYDFWLSLIEGGVKIYQIQETLFFYRVASDSMIRSKKRSQKVTMFKRIFERHTTLFTDNIEVWIDSLLEVRETYYTSKLYLDTGTGVSDANCLSRKVEAGTSEIQFSLEEVKTLTSIRFDPIDTPAVIEIFKISVSNKDGAERELKEYSDNSIFRVANDRYFETDDSQCFIDLSPAELEEINSITIQLSFKALGADALKRIVDFQKDRVQKLSSRFSACDSSGLLQVVAKTLRKRKGEGMFQYLRRHLQIRA